MDFRVELDKNVERSLASVRSLVFAAKHSDNDIADEVCLEILLRGHILVESVENMLKMVEEIRLSQILVNWKTKDELVSAEMKENKRMEERDRQEVKRVVDEARDLEQEISLHLRLSKCQKRLKLAPNQGSNQDDNNDDDQEKDEDV